MRYLGLDLGTRTLGISISDTTKTIASTLKTIRFNDSDYDSLIPELKNIIEEYEISKIVLGLPKNMDNSIGERAEITVAFKEKLEAYFNKEVILEDEFFNDTEQAMEFEFPEEAETSEKSDVCTYIFYK